MRNTIIIILSFFSILLFNSCREDGDWGNDNEGQFGFTIERDNNFIEKAVGEINQLKFNVRPSYDFQSIKTSFKFTTNLNGTLKLNGETLAANQEYTFESKDNIFEYVGNVVGSHNLKISVKNEKGVSKEEEFELKYSVSEFTHTFTGGTTPIYQSDETPYLMKIVPNSGQPTTGYKIKFDTYDGQIKLNGEVVTLGTSYDITNIDSFTTSLKTNVAGIKTLKYSISNSTLSREYSLQQEVLPHTIVLSDFSISKTSAGLDENLIINGIVTKKPASSNSIQYKTWISQGTNGQINGIENTNNIYKPFTLSSNHLFNLAVKTKEVGDYVYNVQFKDEFGNESEVITFNISILKPISIENISVKEIIIEKRRNSINPENTGLYFTYKGTNFKFKVASTPNKVKKIDFIVTFTAFAKDYSYNHSYTLPTEQNEFYYEGTNDVNIEMIGFRTPSVINITNAKVVLKAYDNNGGVAEITLTPDIKIIDTVL